MTTVERYDMTQNIDNIVSTINQIYRHFLAVPSF